MEHSLTWDSTSIKSMTCRLNPYSNGIHKVKDRKGVLPTFSQMYGLNL